MVLGLTRDARRLLRTVNRKDWARAEDHEDNMLSPKRRRASPDIDLNASPRSSSESEPEPGDNKPHPNNEVKQFEPVRPSERSNSLKKPSYRAPTYESDIPKTTFKEPTWTSIDLLGIGEEPKRRKAKPKTYRRAQDDGSSPKKRRTPDNSDPQNRRFSQPKQFAKPRSGSKARRFRKPSSSAARDERSSPEPSTSPVRRTKSRRHTGFHSDPVDGDAAVRNDVAQPRSKPQFRMPAVLAHENDSGLSNPPSSAPELSVSTARSGALRGSESELSGDDVDQDDIISEDPEGISCPMCGARIKPGSEMATKMRGAGSSIRKQTLFCTEHKREEARQQWQSSGYPDIDWARLSGRLSRHRSAVTRILENPSASFFRKELESHVRSGRDRTLLMQLKNQGLARVAPGYYGPKGLKIITDFLLSEFSDELPDLARSDPLIDAAGPAGYVQMVLAPELTAVLVMEDMDVSAEKAREVIAGSAEIGELLNGEDNTGSSRKRSTCYVALSSDDEESDDDC